MQWIYTLAQGNKPASCPWEPNSKRTQAIVKWLTESRLEEIPPYSEDRIAL